MNAKPQQSRSRHPWLAAAPLLLAAAGILFVRAWFGLQFPVPWPDETQFISPAYNLAFHGTLFDWGLNPDRVLMAMPPGYSVLLAGVFKLFGYSFATARWVSTLCMLAALALAGRIAWSARTPGRRLLATCIVGAAFLSPSVLLSSNFSRMEALVCALILAALVASLAGRIYIMAALVVLTATVHFNAIYFVPAVAAEAIARLWTRRLRWPAASDWFALALAAAAIALFAIFIAGNLPGFRADMAEQFRIKAELGRIHDPAHPRLLPICAAGLVLLRALLVRRMDGGMLLALFGAGFVVMSFVGHELWYDYGQPVGFMLLALAATADLTSRPAPNRSRGHTANMILAASLALGIAADMRVSVQQAAFMATPAMLTRDVVAPAEIAKVRRFIANLPPGARVDFGFSGMENLFLPDLDRVGARWTRLNHDLFSPLPFRSSDWRVSCDSSDFLPPLLMFELTIHRVGKDSGCTILPGLVPGNP